MSGPVILVFGLSGVGKTTACEDFAKRHKNFLYLKASALIQVARRIPDHELSELSKSQIEENQYKLIGIVSARRRGREFMPVIVDGHNLIETDDKVIPVPLIVVQQLEPAGIIFLEAPLAYLAARRRADPSRRRPQLSLGRLGELQEYARELADSFAQALSIPIVINSVDAKYQLDPAIFKLGVAL